MKTILFVCIFIWAGVISICHAQGFEQKIDHHINDAQHPCITPAEYKMIEEEIATNRRLLGLSIPNRGSQTLTPLGWPLRPSSSLHDCSYYFIPPM